MAQKVFWLNLPRAGHDTGMIVYLVAALVAAFYLCAVPVRLGVEVRAGQEGRPLIWLGVFYRARLWVKPVPLHLPHPEDKKKQKRGPPPRDMLKAARFLYRRLTIDRLEARVALDDACKTALLAGLLQAALSLVSPHARVRPAFDAPRAQLAALCIATVRLGHIILAALLAARIWITWRLKHGQKAD